MGARRFGHEGEKVRAENVWHRGMLILPGADSGRLLPAGYHC